MDQSKNCHHTVSNPTGLQAPVRNESGQGLAEYSLLLALIAMACISVITLLGEPIRHLFQGAANAL